jgi:hypothetical protein
VDSALQVVLRTSVRGLNFFIVRIVPILYHGVIFCVLSTLIALAAVWTGWPVAAERIALTWMVRASRMNLPSSLDDVMYPVMKAVAHVWIFFGWVLLAHITVWLTGMLL